MHGLPATRLNICPYLRLIDHRFVLNFGYTLKVHLHIADEGYGVLPLIMCIQRIYRIPRFLVVAGPRGKARV